MKSGAVSKAAFTIGFAPAEKAAGQIGSQAGNGEPICVGEFREPVHWLEDFVGVRIDFIGADGGGGDERCLRVEVDEALLAFDLDQLVVDSEAIESDFEAFGGKVFCDAALIIPNDNELGYDFSLGANFICRDVIWTGHLRVS